MGATRKGIRRIFMLNGLIIGLSGTAIGIPLGYAFLWLIQTFWTFDPSVYYISRIPVHVQAMDVLLVALFACCASASLIPLRPLYETARDRQSSQFGCDASRKPKPRFMNVLLGRRVDCR